MAKGCPVAYTQTSAILGYVANQNVGRRKRQADECKSVADSYASSLSAYSRTPAGKSFSADVIYNACINSPIKGYASQMKTDLESVKIAFELYQKYFSSASASEVATKA